VDIRRASPENLEMIRRLMPARIPVMIKQQAQEDAGLNRRPKSQIPCSQRDPLKTISYPQTVNLIPNGKAVIALAL
jgi:hypothetical protein